MEHRVEKVLCKLNKAWKEKVSVEHLARTVNLSSVRLQHLFKQETGMSVTRFVMEKRLAYAADLLRRRRLSVKEVCHRSGFTDPRDFNRSFKKRFGASPSAFRCRAAQLNPLH